MRSLTEAETQAIYATAVRQAENFQLTNSQKSGLALAIQQVWDSGKPIAPSWWVGPEGSWGEQVFGRNPKRASEEAWQAAQQALELAHVELKRQKERYCALLAQEERAAQMGIGTAPTNPTRPCMDDRRLSHC